MRSTRQPLERARAVELDCPVGHSTGEGPDGTGTGDGQPEPLERRVGQLVRGREEMRETELLEAADGCAMARHQSRHQRVRGRHAHLLADDRTHARLERVPCPGWAHSIDQRHEQWVPAQVLVSPSDIGVEVEDAPRPLDVVDQPLPVRKVRAQDEMLLGAARELDHARIAVDPHRATICVLVDALDAGDRARLEVGEHRLPSERLRMRKPQSETAVRSKPVARAATCAQLRRRRMEDLAAGAVELAQAAEARCEGDGGHGQVRVVEQPAREVRAARSRELVRARAEVRREQAPEVARRDAETRAEGVLGVAVEGAVEHKLHGATDQLRA